MPKQKKKGIKRIITQDAGELEKEYFAEYLNYERERRKELRAAAKAAAEEAAAAEDTKENEEAAPAEEGASEDGSEATDNGKTEG